MLLYRAIQLAKQIHEGQVDKAGVPYIMHCLSVMIQGATEDDMILGVLHDTFEDGGTFDVGEKLDELGLGHYETDLYHLTRQKSESYKDYLSRVKRFGPVQVKIADLNHNMDMTRIKNPTDADWARFRKYVKAKEFLLDNTHSM